jgi:UDP:flavonoid glycosyltransferase YjiC (YdhE family)
LPSVAVPQSADNFTIAHRLAAAGTVRLLMPADVSAEGVRRAVRDVVGAEGYRSAAQGVAAEIAAMPSPEEVAQLLRTDDGLTISDPANGDR